MFHISSLYHLGLRQFPKIRLNSSSGNISLLGGENPDLKVLLSLMCLNSEKRSRVPRWPGTFSRWFGFKYLRIFTLIWARGKWGSNLTTAHIFQMGLGTKTQKAEFLLDKFLNKEYRNTVSQFLKENTSLIRVHFPASFVSLPECIWQISQQGWSWLGNYQCWFEIASWQQHVGKDLLWPKLARDPKNATKDLQNWWFFVREIPGEISGKSRWAKYYILFGQMFCCLYMFSLLGPA